MGPVFHVIVGLGVPTALHGRVALSPSTTFVAAGNDLIILGGSADTFDTSKNKIFTGEVERKVIKKLMEKCTLMRNFLKSVAKNFHFHGSVQVIVLYCIIIITKIFKVPQNSRN